MAALSWSLFGLVAALSTGLLAAVFVAVNRMDSLRSELLVEMRGLRSEMRAALADIGRRLGRGGL